MAPVKNNLKNLDSAFAAQRVDSRDRRERFREILVGIRHAVCRRSAPLRRDLFPLCPAIPRSHGQAAGRSHRRDSARDCHRPDQSGAHLPIHRGHHDRNQRSFETVLRTGSSAVLPRVCQAVCVAIRRRAFAKYSKSARARAVIRLFADISGGHPEEFYRSRNQGIAVRPRLHADSREARRHVHVVQDRSCQHPSSVRAPAMRLKRPEGRPRVPRCLSGARRRRFGRLRASGDSPPTCTVQTAIFPTRTSARAASPSILPAALRNLPRLRPRYRRRYRLGDSGSRL